MIEFGIDAEPLPCPRVSARMCVLPTSAVCDAERTQIVAERHLADLQRNAVPGRAVRLHVAAGVEAHARGAAHRRLHVGAREAHAPRRERIDVGCVQLGMAVAGQVVPAQLVAHDEEDVAGGSGHGEA